MSVPTVPKDQQVASNHFALWAALERLARRMATAKGSVLFQQGEAVRGVFLLHKGKIGLSMHSAGRKELPYRIVGRGCVLGFPATFSNAPYSLTAETLTDCELGFVQAEEVIDLLSKRSDLCFHAVEIMSDEVRDLRKSQAALSHVPLNSA